MFLLIDNKGVVWTVLDWETLASEFDLDSEITVSYNRFGCTFLLFILELMNRFDPNPNQICQKGVLSGSVS